MDQKKNKKQLQKEQNKLRLKELYKKINQKTDSTNSINEENIE